MLFNLCISGLPLFELTTLANTTDASVLPDILRSANAVLSLRECTFLGDKGYDVKTVYNLVKDAYEGEAVIPLNKRSTKSPEKLSVGNPICEAGLAISGSCGCISSCLQKSQGGYREGRKVNFKDLLLRAKDGDQQAKEEIFLMYRPLLFKESCVNGIFDEDLFQELSATLIHCIRMFKL